VHIYTCINNDKHMYACGCCWGKHASYPPCCRSTCSVRFVTLLTWMATPLLGGTPFLGV
jgi:hypothetical protein